MLRKVDALASGKRPRGSAMLAFALVVLKRTSLIYLCGRPNLRRLWRALEAAGRDTESWKGAWFAISLRLRFSLSP